MRGVRFVLSGQRGLGVSPRDEAALCSEGRRCLSDLAPVVARFALERLLFHVNLLGLNIAHLKMQFYLRERGKEGVAEKMEVTCLL